MGSDVTTIETAYGLSPTQEGMLFHGLDAGSSGVDLEQVVGTLEEPLDEAAFREGWDRVTARHPILRTAFRWDGLAAPRQEVHDAGHSPVAAPGLARARSRRARSRGARRSWKPTAVAPSTSRAPP